MPQLITRGATITLGLNAKDGTLTLVDVPDLEATILGPNGSTIASGLSPTRHLSTGRYELDYPVAVDAQIGAWAIRWNGTIDGTDAETTEGFTVVAAGSMSTPVIGGITCSPWATSEDVTSGPCSSYETDPDELDEALQIATDMLYGLTRRRWAGICTDVVRPNAEWRAWSAPRWWPASGSSAWGWCSCHRGRESGCSSVPEIKLPGYPVDPTPANITVMIDGVQLDADQYRVDDHRYLVRTDGEGWPCCQNMELDDTEEGTFSIAYPFGAMPPVGGVRAVKVLGCQLMLGWAGDEDCQLPERVTVLTRQGVTMALLDPLTLFDDGKTGVPYVDMWVSSVNRSSDQRSATVIIPGRHRSVRRAGQ